MSWDHPQPTDWVADGPSRGNEGIVRRLRAGAHPSAMLERFSLLTRLFVQALFGGIRFETRCLDNIRDAASRATVVYIMRTRSLIDYLFFNAVLLRHELPLARFANGMSTTVFRPLYRKVWRLVTWPLRFFRRQFPIPAETFKQAVEAGESTFLFLERATFDEYRNQEFSQPYLTRLIDLGQSPGGGPIYVLPLLLVWDKRPDSYRKTIFDEVFGSRESPGFIRKFVYLFQSMWQSIVRASAPTVQVSSVLDLSDFLRENELLNRREKADLLRERLLDVFKRERQVIVGPPIKRPAMIQSEVLSSGTVDEAIVHITRTKPAYPGEVKKQARKIIREIAANFSLVTIKFLSAMLNPVFETLYQGFEIDAAGLDRVRQLAAQRRLVLVPSHKSHMDYLILSNVFYQHGLMPPHIAAGVNLSFWPLGPIFRRAGAFFLRRSFRGDILYSAIFRQYLVTLLREGFPIEFFIEGTRSRTGKLCRPRYGMLSMIVNGALAEGLKDVTFIPISIGYEKIIESGSYTREALGAEKQAENLSGVIKASRFLKSKHGRLYIEFGEAIEVDQLLTRCHITDSSDREDRAQFNAVLGNEIIDRINKATTVTPSSLVAMALLNYTGAEIHLATLLSHLGFLVNLLLAKGCRLSNSIRGALAVYRAQVGSSSQPPLERYPAPPGPGEPRPGRGHRPGESPSGELPNWEAGRALQEVVHQTLSLLGDYDWIKIKKHTDGQVFSIDEDHRPDLGYLRNTIVHFFLPEMLLAASLAVCEGPEVEERALWGHVRELADHLRFEFSVSHEDRMLQEFHLALDRFIEKGWLIQELPGDRILKPHPLPLPIEYLGRLLTTWLEGYWLVGSSLGYIEKEPMEAREFLKLCLKLSQRQSFLNRESISKPTYEVALEWFEENGVIQAMEVPGERRKSSRLLRIHDEWLEDSRWRTVSERMMTYLTAMEDFLVPCVPFEQIPQAEDIGDLPQSSQTAASLPDTPEATPIEE